MQIPYVNIKITDLYVSQELKAELIVSVTTLLQKALNKNPATTIDVINQTYTDYKAYQESK